MTMFIDSHAHLADPAFDGAHEGVIARARAAGAVAVVCIGESPAAAIRARDIALREPGFLFFTAGVHPHDAAAFDAARDLDSIRTLAAEGAVAVGECGLDYHYDHSPRDRQREVFRAQLALAAELHLPVVVHTREADDDMRAMLAEARALGVRGVLHCFTGSHELARAGLDAGWLISFSGVITFRSWKDRELLRLVPLERLLVESDAPYLAPVPHRGARNEPSWVPRTIETLSEARGSDIATLGTALSHNAIDFFGLPSSLASASSA